MKKIIAFILIILTLFSQNVLAEMYYFDIYEHWAEDYIYWATNEVKIFNGYNDWTFRPENNITRAEYITILFRAADEREIIEEVYSSDMQFNDFNISHWSYTYVISVREFINNSFSRFKFEEIFDDEIFEPDKPITREEALVLTAAFSAPEITDNEVIFDDMVNDIHNYKYNYEIKKLFNNEIIEGYDDNTFRPSSFIERSEAATMIKRIFDDMKYIEDTYLTNIEFLESTEKDVFSLFGNYDYNDLSEMDKKYIKAKNTLEYTSFGGYIFPEDEHLYDEYPLATLLDLKDQNYFNIAGINYYLLRFGDLTEEEKDDFAHELLIEVLDREDLQDSDIIKIFNEVVKRSSNENFFNGALEKWYNNTEKEEIKANILFFRYKYYLNADNKDMLRALVLNDINKEYEINKIIAIDWKIDESVTNTAIIFELNDNITQEAIEIEDNVSQAAVDIEDEITLENEITVENEITSDSSIAVSTNEFSDIIIKYIFNRAYILKYLELYEEGVILLYNDWEYIKGTEFYEQNYSVIDDMFKGAIKHIKIRLL